MKPSYDTFQDNLSSRYAFIPEKIERSRGASDFLQALALYWRTYRTRKQLSRLTEDQLKDIGITVEDAGREASKYFWQ